MTLGELGRRLDRLEDSLNSRFGEVTHRLENLQFVPRDTYLVQMNALTERVESLEQAKTWFSRSMVVAFLFPVAVAIVVALVLTNG